MSKIAKLVTRLPQLSASAVEFATPHLQEFVRLAKVELRPPTPSEIGQSIPLAKKGFQNLVSGKFTQLTVKEALLNTLVFTEVACWFFVGEVIGRGSLVGYDV